MKKSVLQICIGIAIALSVLQAHAGEAPRRITAPLKSATLFRNGAELLHSVRIQLTTGNNTLQVAGLSNQLDVNSLRVNCEADMTILSLSFSNDFLHPQTDALAIQKIKDSIEQTDERLALVQVQIRTNQELLELLKANNQLGDKGSNVQQLQEMMQYYKTKLPEVQKDLLHYQAEEKKLQSLADNLRKQLQEETKTGEQSVGQLTLELLSPVAGTYDFTITYMTRQAHWTPFYDLRVDAVDQPAQLFYRARLAQTTGIDWKQVKLSLASATPGNDNQAPVIEPWFLGYINPFSSRLDNGLQGKVAGVNTLNEVQVLGYGQADKKATIQIRGSNSLSASAQPLYIVNGVPGSASKVAKISPDDIKEIEVIKGADATAIYGTRAVDGVVLITLKDGLTDYVTVNEQAVNVTFDIDLPYDIPAGGKERIATLKEYQVPAFYQYYTVPRKEERAFLTAGITDWGQYNLLPGEANLIFEHTYVGKTIIDPASTADTLLLTVASDKRVIVTRQKQKDFSSVKFLGSNKTQTFVYELTIRNTKKEKIEVEVRDQYPLSSDKEIEVEILNTDGADVNKETGMLSWKLTLAPGETQKKRISYSIKYPKYKLVNVE